MEIALLRTLTNREFYEANKNLVKEKIFRSKESRQIKAIIDKAMREYERDIHSTDIEALFWAANPALTTSQREVYQTLFNKLHACTPLNTEVTQDVLTELNREDAANELMDISFKMSNGEITSLYKIKEFIDRREEDLRLTLSRWTFAL